MKMLNDPIKLAFNSEMTDAEIDRLDLTLLQEIKRGRDGAVEIKLVDKVKLAELSGLNGGDTDALDKLISALDEAGKAMK